MARELTAILSELNNIYDPQRQTKNQQLEALDPALQAEEKGLEFAKKDAFDTISNTANRRGMFYSGLPIAEEQRYTGGTYLPALANLRGKYTQQRFNLKDALDKIKQDEYNQAYGIRQGELDMEEKQRQFDAQMAAQRAASAGSGSGAYAPSFGAGSGPSGPAYGMQKRANGGFNFVGPNGQAVSAATYAAATGVPFRQLLQQMANAGDSGARQALGFVGDDYRYDPSKIGVNAPLKTSNQAIYNALTWGASINNSRGGGGRAPAQGGGGGGW